MPTDNMGMYVLIAFIAINLIAFLIMFFDKRKAINSNSERISEGMMFFLGSLFGGIGIYVGMFVLHHKTQKWYFLVGIPLIIMQNIATIYLVYMLFIK